MKRTKTTRKIHMRRDVRMRKSSGRRMTMLSKGKENVHTRGLWELSLSDEIYRKGGERERNSSHTMIINRRKEGRKCIYLWICIDSVNCIDRGKVPFIFCTGIFLSPSPLLIKHPSFTGDTETDVEGRFPFLSFSIHIVDIHTFGRDRKSSSFRRRPFRPFNFLHVCVCVVYLHVLLPTVNHTMCVCHEKRD